MVRKRKDNKSAGEDTNSPKPAAKTSRANNPPLRQRSVQDIEDVSSDDEEDAPLDDDGFVARCFLNHVYSRKRRLSKMQLDEGVKAVPYEHRTFQFLTKWEDTPKDKWSEDKYDTWEPWDSFGSANTVMVNYLIRHPEIANHSQLSFFHEAVVKKIKKLAKKRGVGVQDVVAPFRQDASTSQQPAEPINDVDEKDDIAIIDSSPGQPKLKPKPKSKPKVAPKIKSSSPDSHPSVSKKSAPVAQKKPAVVSSSKPASSSAPKDKGKGKATIESSAVAKKRKRRVIESDESEGDAEERERYNVEYALNDPVEIPADDSEDAEFQPLDDDGDADRKDEAEYERALRQRAEEKAKSQPQTAFPSAAKKPRLNKAQQITAIQQSPTTANSTPQKSLDVPQGLNNKNKKANAAPLMSAIKIKKTSQRIPTEEISVPAFEPTFPAVDDVLAPSPLPMSALGAAGHKELDPATASPIPKAYNKVIEDSEIMDLVFDSIPDGLEENVERLTPAPLPTTPKTLPVDLAQPENLPSMAEASGEPAVDIQAYMLEHFNPNQSAPINEEDLMDEDEDDDGDDGIVIFSPPPASPLPLPSLAAPELVANQQNGRIADSIGAIADRMQNPDPPLPENNHFDLDHFSHSPILDNDDFDANPSVSTVNGKAAHDLFSASEEEDAIPNFCTRCKKAGCDGVKKPELCQNVRKTFKPVPAAPPKVKQIDLSNTNPRKMTKLSQVKRPVIIKQAASHIAKNGMPKVLKTIATAPKTVANGSTDITKNGSRPAEDKRPVAGLAATPQTAAVESDSSVEEFDALFDGNDSSRVNLSKGKGNMSTFGTIRVAKDFGWAQKDSEEATAYLLHRLSGTRVIPTLRLEHQKHWPLLQFVATYWPFHRCLGSSPTSIFKGHKVYLRAGDWSRDPTKDLATTGADVFSMQLACLHGGASYVGPDANDATVILIHTSELRRPGDMQRLLSDATLSNLRRKQSTTFYVFGTRNATSTLPVRTVLFPIWNMGFALTFTPDAIISDLDIFSTAVGVCGDHWPRLTAWLHAGMFGLGTKLGPSESTENVPVEHLTAYFAVACNLAKSDYNRPHCSILRSLPAPDTKAGTDSSPAPSFPSYADTIQVLPTAEDSAQYTDPAFNANPADALIESACNYAIKYYGIKRWFVVTSAIEEFSFLSQKRSLPVEVINSGRLRALFESQAKQNV